MPCMAALRMNWMAMFLMADWYVCGTSCSPWQSRITTLLSSCATCSVSERSVLSKLPTGAERCAPGTAFAGAAAAARCAMNFGAWMIWVPFSVIFGAREAAGSPLEWADGEAVNDLRMAN